MSTDPAVRYTAAGILFLAFAGCLAIVVHGYWYNPTYEIPAPISWVLGGAVSGALTLLGVHIGSNGAQVAVGTGAKVVHEAIANGAAQKAA